MSLFGLWSSAMVVVVYYYLNESLPFCPSSTFFGIALDCNKVLGSSYSMVFGVPLELLAVVYFVVNLLLVFFIAFGGERLFETSIDVLFIWRFIGILIVPYLVFVEVFLIKAICLYCTIMHIAIVADFAIISYLLFFRQGGLFASTEPEDSSGLARTPTP